MERLYSNTNPAPVSPSLFFRAQDSADPIFTERSEAGRDRILAGIDDTATSPAVVRHAAAIADSLGLSLTLARVIEPSRGHDAPANPIEWQMRCNEGRDQLNRVSDFGQSDSASVEKILLTGEPAKELNSWAEHNKASIVALASRAVRTLVPDGLGTTARRILAKGATSILLVPAAEPDAKSITYRKLMVPLDGSIYAESALPLALRIARAGQAEIVLVNVLPKLEQVQRSPLGASRSKVLAEFAAENERFARDYLEDLAHRMTLAGSKVRTAIITDGDPRIQLRRFIVENQIDLAVLSAHGHSRLGDVPCGSVTEYLATQAPAPMLIVRSDFMPGFDRLVSNDRGSTRHPAAFSDHE